jgi:fructose-bisphosphate aldolase class 1
MAGHGRRAHTGHVWRSDRASAAYPLRELYSPQVRLEGLILKPNMVLPGSTCATQQTVDEVADATRDCSMLLCGIAKSR